MSELIYHGHSFVEIRHNEHIILIDPFCSDNPLCDVKQEDLQCNYIILSHGHGDHFGDTYDIAKRNDATVIATSELAVYCDSKGLKMHEMNLGGAFKFPFGRVKLTPALHSSSTPEGGYAGHEAGIIVGLEGGKCIYHAGDTALFYDMKLIGEMNKIDYAFLPIGDNFTMGVDDAVKAAQWINPQIVVPMHYNTFDVIKADPDEFKRKIETTGGTCEVMSPGSRITI